MTVSSGNDRVHIGDSANLDAFGRLRTGQPFGIFDSKSVYNEDPNAWGTILVGGASAIAHNPVDSTVTMTVDSAVDDRVVRQTLHYHPYVPGKSHNITTTGAFGDGVAGIKKRWGYYDDNNGIFWELDGTDVSLTLRSDSSGSIVSEKYMQNAWNLDKLDGSGPSGVTLDPTQAHILCIDMQWLGVGRVRVGFIIGGKLILVHEFNHANKSTTTYMRRPDLPVRYEMLNVTGAASTTMKSICASVASEGGYTLPGFEFSTDTGIATRSVTTRVPIIAIRHKATFNSVENRSLARLLKIAFRTAGNDILWEFAHVHDPSAITATWNDVQVGQSSVEVSTDITAVTGNPSHKVDSGFLSSAQGSFAQTLTQLEDHVSRHSFISQNVAADNSQMFVLYATSFGGSATVSGAIHWVESR